MYFPRAASAGGVRLALLIACSLRCKNRREFAMNGAHLNLHAEDSSHISYMRALSLRELISFLGLEVKLNLWMLSKLDLKRNAFPTL